MNSREPIIKNVRLFKTNSDIKVYRSVDKQIRAIENDIYIKYHEPEEENRSSSQVEFGASLECHIHNSEGSDPKETGEILALIEVMCTAYLDYYSHEYLNYVMSSVWPYLRSAAELQMQILDLNPVARQLPYKV